MAEQRTFQGVQLSYCEHWVEIETSDTLRRFLGGPDEDPARTLSRHILEEYDVIFGKPLHVSLPSMAVEILVHVYHDVLSAALNTTRLPLPPRAIARLREAISSIRPRAHLIDVGEPDVDHNRWVFDYLGQFCGVIESFLELHRPL